MKTVLEEHELKQVMEDLSARFVAAHSDLSDIVFMGILSKGYPIATRIASMISSQSNVSIPVGKLDISMYRDDLQDRQGYVTIQGSEIPCDLTDKIVVLVDDVLFHGRTIRAAMDAVTDFGRPRKTELLVLIDRGHRQFPIMPNYTGLLLETQRDDYVTVNLYEIEAKDQVLVGEKI